MDKKLKAKWVKALRSGKYAQGIGELKCESDEPKNKFEFCCLGVLRDIAHPKSTLSSCDSGVFLSDRHLKEFGLSDGYQNKLAEKNDSGWSFSRIATWIEKNIK